jgi:hypothetical protein
MSPPGRRGRYGAQPGLGASRVRLPEPIRLPRPVRFGRLVRQHYASTDFMECCRCSSTNGRPPRLPQAQDRHIVVQRPRYADDFDNDLLGWYASRRPGVVVAGSFWSACARPRWVLDLLDSRWRDLAPGSGHTAATRLKIRTRCRHRATRRRGVPTRLRAQPAHSRVGRLTRAPECQVTNSCDEGASPPRDIRATLGLIVDRRRTGHANQGIGPDPAGELGRAG